MENQTPCFDLLIWLHQITLDRLPDRGEKMD